MELATSMPLVSQEEAMPALTIHVPPDHRDDVLRALLGLYAVKADALHYAVDRYLQGEGSLEPLLGHRSGLAVTEALIEQLGWRLNAPPERARLTGDNNVLAEIARGALDSAVHELGEALSKTGGEAPNVEAIGWRLRRVTGLFELLQVVNRPVASPA